VTREELWLLMSHLDIGSAVLQKILKAFHDPEEILTGSGAALTSAGFLTDRQKGELLRVRRDAASILRESERMEKEGMRFVSREHPDFPQRLLKIPDPPAGLYVIGRLPDQAHAFLAVVGSRGCSEYGRECAEMLAGGAARAGAVIVSGMAAGIDGTAQRAALRTGIAGCPSEAVLAGGADRIYPASNRDLYRELCERGAVISENPPGTVPEKYRFPQRNRLISGLSDAVLVVEARPGSGSLITSDQALDQGRTVMAVPGNIFSELSSGCNSLIRQGAVPVSSVEDVCAELGLMAPGEPGDEEEEMNLTDQERDLLDLFPPRGELIHFEDLLIRSKYPAGDLSLMLLRLAQCGAVKEAPGNYYELALRRRRRR
jgi:DNA processing protein